MQDYFPSGHERIIKKWQLQRRQDKRSLRRGFNIAVSAVCYARQLKQHFLPKQITIPNIPHQSKGKANRTAGHACLNSSCRLYLGFCHLVLFAQRSPFMEHWLRNMIFVEESPGYYTKAEHFWKWIKLQYFLSILWLRFNVWLFTFSCLCIFPQKNKKWYIKLSDLRNNNYSFYRLIQCSDKNKWWVKLWSLVLWWTCSSQAAFSLFLLRLFNWTTAAISETRKTLQTRVAPSSSVQH